MRLIICIFMCGIMLSSMGMDTYRAKRDAILKAESPNKKIRFEDQGDSPLQTEDQKDARLQKIQNDLQTDSDFLKESSVEGFIISAIIGCFSSIPLGFAWNELSRNDNPDCMPARANYFYLTACVACMGTCAMAGMALCDCCKAKQYAKKSDEIKKTIAYRKAE